MNKKTLSLHYNLIIAYTNNTIITKQNKTYKTSEVLEILYDEGIKISENFKRVCLNNNIMLREFEKF